MPAFVHPALLWALGLIAVPVLIHLINLWRHRRVRWAAMEFLLESKKKNQRWVMLRQLLLLLARMMAIAALVLVLAQPLLKNRLGALVGTAKTHHLILLDDSFSMADRWAQTSAFEQAREAVARIAQQAGSSGPGHLLTLLRFSRAGDKSVAPKPDLHLAAADVGAVEKLAAILKQIQVSATSAGPLPAVAAARHLAGEQRGDKTIMYLVSDFRRNQWNEAEALRDSLSAWSAQGGEIHFVHCVDQPHANLAVTALVPQRGLLAAAVPFFMEVTVQNFGHEAVRDVAVSLSEDGHQRPALVIDQIGAGQAETRRVLVNFRTAGQHVVSASLEPDSIITDNSRAAVVDLPLGLPVLLVDGAEDAVDARFLSLALSPGGAIPTGIDVEVQSPRHLVDVPLTRYRTIYLANVANLQESAVKAVDDYVHSGGSLVIFLGEASSSQFVNQYLYRGGHGVFPFELAAPTRLFADESHSAPDLQITPHPIFKVFLGERNSFLNSVSVDRYFAVTKNAEQAAGSTTHVIARLRNGAPLVAEKKFGRGRVMAFLTSAAPTWNNWGRNPSFVVAMLELQSYLVNQDEPAAPYRVGSPLHVAFSASRYQPHVRFLLPGDAEPLAVGVNAVRKGEVLEAVLQDTDRPGIYDAELTTLDGRSENRRFAVGVAPEEGDPALIDGADLAARLAGLKFAQHRASDLNWNPSELAGFNLSDGLLYCLVALLIGEQLLAYRNTYHPRAREGGK